MKNLSTTHSKKLVFIITILLLLSASVISNAQTIWNTGSQVFAKTMAGEQDCITPQNCLTRVTVLYNAVCETVSGQQGCSYTGPCNTEWAFGNIADWSTLTYDPLYVVNNCNPPGTMVGNPLVCHLIAEDIYLQITFDTWQTGGSNFSYTRTTGSPLPVLISKFIGYKKENMNILNWTSSTESNCSHYNIQRSINETDFITVGRVDTKSSDGNSSIPLDYSYSDEHPMPGHNNYRLEQVDKDGRKHYSQVVYVFFSNAGRTTILQNPAKQINLYISSEKESKATIKVLDINCRLLKTINTHIEKGNTSLQVSLDNLPAGLYIVQMYKDAQLSFSEKVIKQ